MLAFLKAQKMPHVFVLITAVIAVCSLATYFYPSGSYERKTVVIEGTSRSVVVPGTYKSMEKHITAKGLILEQGAPESKAAPTSFHGFLMAVPRGLEKSGGIIFFIFLIGGTFGILQRSGVITATIHWLLDTFSGNDKLLIIVIMAVLAVGGSTMGMGEEFIPLVPIFLIVADRMGYDRIVGLSMVILAAQIGFAAATTNPFTIGVAQGIAEVELYSGITFRVIFLIVSFVITLAYILRYGKKIKADPSKSLVADEPVELDTGAGVDKLTGRHVGTIVMCVLLFCVVIYGSRELHWWMAEMSGAFVLMGILAAIICKMKLEEATEAFVKGMGEMVVAALVVGFARGIEVVLTNAMVLDSLIHSAAGVLKDVPQFIAVQGMFVFQTTLNFLIPSGSGQAAVTMPLMAPLADVLGITRQTAVFAFQCGDGFSNILIPTSGILMSMLALAKIPYSRWLRFIFPLFLILCLNAAVFLTIAVVTQFS